MFSSPASVISRTVCSSSRRPLVLHGLEVRPPRLILLRVLLLLVGAVVIALKKAEQDIAGMVFYVLMILIGHESPNGRGGQDEEEGLHAAGFSFLCFEIHVIWIFLFSTL